MSEYLVSIPLSGRAVVIVEAETEEEAVEKAMDGVITKENIEEWECHKQIVNGNVLNVFYGISNEIEVEKLRQFTI